MDFIIKDLNDNILNIARKIGYIMLEAKNINEYNLVRKLTGNHYPRFHIYAKQMGGHYDFSLHLDQKAPVYKGGHAHSGEYDGPAVENESDRIKQILQ